MEEATELTRTNYLKTAAEIVAAYVSHHSVQSAELPQLIANVSAALSGLGAAAREDRNAEKPTPAQIKKSVAPDALISFIDGKPYQVLKRHLQRHGLDMQGYRARFGLPADYPATAANFSARRAEIARSSGLGRRPKKMPNVPAQPKSERVMRIVASREGTLE